MNRNLDFLNAHVSVRQFTEQPISTEDELKIISTSQRSASSSNIQAYSIISIRNQATKAKISSLASNQKHITDSALFLFFCADLNRLNKINKSKNYEFNGDTTDNFIVATIDAALVADRALQAAQALGMGGVMVGAIRDNVRQISEILKLPKLVYPIMGLSLGYPVSLPKQKPRLPMDAIYMTDSYDDSKFDQAINQYDQTMAETGLYVGRAYRAETYPDFEERYSWSEHTARKMAAEPGSRLLVKDYLLKQGFMKR